MLLCGGDHEELLPITIDSSRLGGPAAIRQMYLFGRIPGNVS